MQYVFFLFLPHHRHSALLLIINHHVILCSLLIILLTVYGHWSRNLGWCSLQKHRRAKLHHDTLHSHLLVGEKKEEERKQETSYLYFTTKQAPSVTASYYSFFSFLCLVSLCSSKTFSWNNFRCPHFFFFFFWAHCFIINVILSCWRICSSCANVSMYISKFICICKTWLL